MNREETLALYEQGKDAWNKWSNEMLEERKRLEESGEWNVKKDHFGDLIPQDETTKAWFKKAEANFSSYSDPNNFKDEENFTELKFPGKALFEQATFHTTTFFEKCMFSGEACFESAVFLDGFSITDASFDNFTNFKNTTFENLADFQACKFFDDASFTVSTFKGFTNFSNITVNNGLYFNGALSKSSFTFEKNIFKTNLPEFIQANFKEAPPLDNIKFGPDIAPGSFINSITTFIHPDIKARYQALKRIAIQAHDHENEQRFWAGELRSDRSLRNEDGGWNLRPLVSAFWWGNIAYGCVSDYGRSIVKPIGALLILICLMTGLHLTKSKTPLTYDQAFSAGYIAANKSLLYLGTDPTKRSIIKEKYTALYGANGNQTPKIPKTILTPEFIQTLLSAIFIFLALLGIRNNFKMK